MKAAHETVTRRGNKRSEYFEGDVELTAEVLINERKVETLLSGRKQKNTRELCGSGKKEMMHLCSVLLRVKVL